MKRSAFFRSPLFWTGMVILAIACSIFLYFNFEKANPLVNISVEMSRDEALALASNLSEEHHLGPTEFRQAASFQNDSRFQNYTELEGGGLDVFNSIISTETYASYQWKVRHFKEKEVNEVTFSFTPSGELYGFIETIGEEVAGPELTVDSALIIANQAAQKWNINLNNYQLVEKSMDKKPGGRLDHEFVYERTDVKVNESKFRISMKVSGDKVTSIHHFVKIPDDFDRRYAEMRSNNNLISTIGQAILFLVYGIIGVGLGIFFLMKQRFLLWKKALYWSVGIGLGTGLLYTMNVMPLMWLDYDTSQSAGSFLSRNLLGGLLQTILMGSVVFISALAGEGLGRFLFKDQVQFWKVWGKEAGGSVTILGQTIGGYLFIPVFLAIDVLYYLFTSIYLGWWNPAGTLSDPDILAQNLPWFGSIAISLQAGFWEEVICRAVPLAGVYLLVRNLKSKNWWMLLALLAQTIFFGMLHANYPQSPAFARVLEMIVPFIIFGLIYLKFGLLPVIIAHYAIDVFWISLPLWVASSPGIWFNRIMIILLFFVPLWVVLYWRWKNKKWIEVPASSLNGAWEPVSKPIYVAKTTEQEIKNETVKEHQCLSLKWLIPGAIAGLVLWGVFTFPIKHQTPQVEVNRERAIEMAKGVLTSHFDIQPNEWSVLTSIDDQPQLSHKFVWREFEQNYPALQNSFLNTPNWEIRLIKTKAPVEERSEEYKVSIGVDGSVLGYRHIWPEKRESESLTEAEALSLVQKELMKSGVDHWDALEMVSINPSKLESRTDWKIEYSDTLNYELSQGQGRYQVSIAGNEVNGLKKYVFVPENWEREYNKKKSTLGIFTVISNLLMYAIIIFGIVLGFINWSRKRFSTQMFLTFGLIFLVISVLAIINSWNDITAQYYTNMPYSNFITMTLIGALIGFVFLSLGVGVIGGFSCEMAKNDLVSEKPIVKALLFGILLAGVQTMKMSWIPQLSPKWFSLGNMNDQITIVGLVVDQMQRFIFNPAFAIILFYLINLITKNFSKLKILGITFIFVAGFVASGGNANSVNSWLLIGACSGIIFIFLFLLLKNHLNWMPMIFVVSLILQQIEKMMVHQFQGAIAGAILSIFIWTLVSVMWYNGIIKCNKSK